MNRRGFLLGALATPIVAALAPLLRSVVPVTAYRPARGLVTHGFIDKADLSELLMESMRLEQTMYEDLPIYSSSRVPPDTIWLLDAKRLVSPVDHRWFEDA